MISIHLVSYVGGDKVYMQQGVNPYSLVHDGGPSAGHPELKAFIPEIF